MDDDFIIRLKQDYHNAGLSAADVVMLEYAERITVDPAGVTEADVQRLRQHGFSDEEILDIAVLAAYRNFVGRLADALGVELGPEYDHMSPELRSALMGRKQL